MKSTELGDVAFLNNINVLMMVMMMTMMLMAM